MNAVIIATMFDGIQSPGDFTYTWNGRDDSGRLLPVGDYVGEVRIGKEKLIRKRIYLSR
jgi:flagellar hook assembly protein FlgD